MNTSKILTVSIAAYNMQSYLSRCLDSVLHPEVLEAIEVLVVNDGSKDNTLKIAQEYEERYPGTVRVIDKPNGGHGSTVNKGIELATGKYFRLLDADDWFDAGNFVLFVEKLRRLDSDLVITPYSQEFVFEQRSVPYTFKNVRYGEIYDFQNWPGMQGIGMPWFDLPAITYRTSILQKQKIRISECFYSDIEFDCLPLEFIHSVIFLDIPVYRYFIGREGQSVSPEGCTRNYEDHLYICKNMIDFYLAHQQTGSNVLKTMYTDIVFTKIATNYVMLMRHYTDRQKAQELLKDFDGYLKNKNEYLYRTVARRWTLAYFIKPIAWWRKSGFNIYQTSIYKIFRLIYRKFC